MFSTISTNRQTNKYNSVDFSFFKNKEGIKMLLTAADSVFLCII